MSGEDVVAIVGGSYPEDPSVERLESGTASPPHSGSLKSVDSPATVNNSQVFSPESEESNSEQLFLNLIALARLIDFQLENDCKDAQNLQVTHQKLQDIYNRMTQDPESFRADQVKRERERLQKNNSSQTQNGSQRLIEEQDSAKIDVFSRLLKNCIDKYVFFEVKTFPTFEKAEALLASTLKTEKGVGVDEVTDAAAIKRQRQFSDISVEAISKQPLQNPDDLPKDWLSLPFLWRFRPGRAKYREIKELSNKLKNKILTPEKFLNDISAIKTTDSDERVRAKIKEKKDSLTAILEKDQVVAQREAESFFKEFSEMLKNPPDTLTSGFIKRFKKCLNLSCGDDLLMRLSDHINSDFPHNFEILWEKNFFRRLFLNFVDPIFKDFQDFLQLKFLDWLLVDSTDRLSILSHDDEALAVVKEIRIQIEVADAVNQSLIKAIIDDVLQKASEAESIKSIQELYQKIVFIFDRYSLEPTSESLSQNNVEQLINVFLTCLESSQDKLSLYQEFEKIFEFFKVDCSAKLKQKVLEQVKREITSFLESTLDFKAVEIFLDDVHLLKKEGVLNFEGDDIIFSLDSLVQEYLLQLKEEKQLEVLEYLMSSEDDVVKNLFARNIAPFIKKVMNTEYTDFLQCDIVLWLLKQFDVQARVQQQEDSLNEIAPKTICDFVKTYVEQSFLTNNIKNLPSKVGEAVLVFNGISYGKFSDVRQWGESCKKHSNAQRYFDEVVKADETYLKHFIEQVAKVTVDLIQIDTQRILREIQYNPQFALGSESRQVYRRALVSGIQLRLQRFHQLAGNDFAVNNTELASLWKLYRTEKRLSGYLDMTIDAEVSRTLKASNDHLSRELSVYSQTFISSNRASDPYYCDNERRQTLRMSVKRSYSAIKIFGTRKDLGRQDKRIDRMKTIYLHRRAEFYATEQQAMAASPEFGTYEALFDEAGVDYPRTPRKNDAYYLLLFSNSSFNPQRKCQADYFSEDQAKKYSAQMTELFKGAPKIIKEMKALAFEKIQEMREINEDPSLLSDVESELNNFGTVAFEDQKNMSAFRKLRDLSDSSYQVIYKISYFLQCLKSCITCFVKQDTSKTGGLLKRISYLSNKLNFDRNSAHNQFWAKNLRYCQVLVESNQYDSCEDAILYMFKQGYWKEAVFELRCFLSASQESKVKVSEDFKSKLAQVFSTIRDVEKLDMLEEMGIVKALDLQPAITKIKVTMQFQADVVNIIRTILNGSEKPSLLYGLCVEQLGVNIVLTDEGKTQLRHKLQDMPTVTLPWMRGAKTKFESIADSETITNTEIESLNEALSKVWLDCVHYKLLDLLSGKNELKHVAPELKDRYGNAELVVKNLVLLYHFRASSLSHQDEVKILENLVEPLQPYIDQLMTAEKLADIDLEISPAMANGLKQAEAERRFQALEKKYAEYNQGECVHTGMLSLFGGQSQNSPERAEGAQALFQRDTENFQKAIGGLAALPEKYQTLITNCRQTYAKCFVDPASCMEEVPPQSERAYSKRRGR